MRDHLDERDVLAAELEEEGFEVMDTFGGLGPGDPAIALEVPVEIEGTTFEGAELLVTVSEDVHADSVSVYDEPDDRLTDEQRETLDDVCDEKYTEPDLTLWEYTPGSAEDDVDEIVADVEAAFRSIDT